MRLLRAGRVHAAWAATSPPVGREDDEAEPNDAASTPHSVTLEAQAPPEQSSNPAAPGAEESAQDKLTWKRALLACPGDAEWYAVHLEPGDRLTANLDATEGPSPLGLNLHTPGATRRLRPPSGQDELITSLELTSSSGGKGDYILEVSNPETDEVPYGLEIVVRPACHRVEDHLEDNDTQFEAKDVTPGPIDGLKLCPGDPDWYAVTLADGESLFVFASPQGDEEEEAQEPQDAPPAPSLELSLYDEAGTLISDGAPADASRVATLLNPGEGRYLIRVGGPIDLETRYQLLVQVVPPCPDGDDQHEDNDMVEDATDLMALMNPQGGAGGQGGGQGGAPQPQLLRICPGDVDWFSFTSNPEAPTVVSLVFEHAKGDLGLRLTDPTGSETLETIDASSPQQNGEAVQIPKSQEVSSYALEVRARDLEENFYLLRLEQPQGGGEGSPESDDEEQEEPPEEQEEQEEEEEQEPPPPQEEEEEQTPLEDRLDKLDHNPNNLEALQKALESRRGPPEKDW